MSTKTKRVRRQRRRRIARAHVAAASRVAAPVIETRSRSWLRRLFR